jgi:hypothetical protein
VGDGPRLQRASRPSTSPSPSNWRATARRKRSRRPIGASDRRGPRSRGDVPDRPPGEDPLNGGCRARIHHRRRTPSERTDRFGHVGGRRFRSRSETAESVRGYRFRSSGQDAGEPV